MQTCSNKYNVYKNGVKAKEHYNVYSTVNAGNILLFSSWTFGDYSTSPFYFFM